MAPWFGLVIMLGIASFFYKAAEFEDLSFPALWAGGSCLLYISSIHWWDFGLCGALAIQLLLLVAMGIAMQFDKHRNEFSLAQIKSRWYLRQGRCPSCGYDLTGTQRPGLCPECGEKVPAKDA